MVNKLFFNVIKCHAYKMTYLEVKEGDNYCCKIAVEFNNNERSSNMSKILRSSQYYIVYVVLLANNEFTSG